MKLDAAQRDTLPFRGMTQPDPPKRDQIVAKVAGNVRSALAYRSVSERSTSAALGISTAAVARRMTGEVPFDVADLVIIAGIVGLTPGHLIDGEPWTPARPGERAPIY